MTLTLSVLIGFLAGLRSLTPPAAASWAAHLGWLKLQGGLAVMASLTAAVNFTILAAIELVVDKLPKTPNRTAAFALVFRMLTGGLAGACVAMGGGEGALPGAALGAIGGVAGGFGGFLTRRALVRALALPDFYVAIAEDLICIVACLLIVSRFA